MTTIEDVFCDKKTWNGDSTFSSTSNKLVDLLFFAESYKNDLESAKIAVKNAKSELSTDFGKYFSMMIRDPRFGLGYRDYGILLELAAGLSFDEMVLSGRFDDLLKTDDENRFTLAVEYLANQIRQGNELAKKWMPRATSSKKILASKIRKILGMSKQEYNKFIKVTTTESLLTERRVDEIIFQHVPSLASIKYANRFSQDDMAERYESYLEDVKLGKSKINVSTSTVYDIFKNRNKINPDVFFSQIKKIQLSCVPIVDTSGSMMNSRDSIGKAVSIGHYLAKCSSYMPNKVITFDSNPQIVDISSSSYIDEIETLYHIDWGGSTNLKAVMDLLKQCDEFPEYLIILSDMEFDEGSRYGIMELEQYFDSIGCKTKIVWWNLNSYDRCSPEKIGRGNVFMSGYSPMLLEFLNSKFDEECFLNTLVEQYKNKIHK